MRELIEVTVIFCAVQLFLGFQYVRKRHLGYFVCCLDVSTQYTCSCTKRVICCRQCGEWSDMSRQHHVCCLC